MEKAPRIFSLRAQRRSPSPSASRPPLPHFVRGEDKRQPHRYPRSGRRGGAPLRPQRKNPWSFFHASETSRIIVGVLPAGNASGVVRKRGRTGASASRQTKSRDWRGRVQGFPCRHYGRCVLDEHIGGTGEGRGFEACPRCCRAQMPGGVGTGHAQRNGRKQKSPAGRGSRATY